MACLVFLLWHSLVAALPTGALYSRTLTLPIIGRQTVSLAIVSPSVARLLLSGHLVLDEPVVYQFLPSGDIKFHLTDETKRVLRAYRTTLIRAEYEEVSDTPVVVLSPPLPTLVHFRLKRV
jgi:hypothetical protein